MPKNLFKITAQECKKPLPVDAQHPSEMSLLKLPNILSTHVPKYFSIWRSVFKIVSRHSDKVVHKLIFLRLIYRSLEKNTYDHVTATYYLLAEQLLRRLKTANNTFNSAITRRRTNGRLSLPENVRREQDSKPRYGDQRSLQQLDFSVSRQFLT